MSQLLPSMVSSHWALAAVLGWSILLILLARRIWKIATGWGEDRSILGHTLREIKSLLADKDAFGPVEREIAELLVVAID
jgi:hypothetical protein